MEIAIVALGILALLVFILIRANRKKPKPQRKKKEEPEFKRTQPGTAYVAMSDSISCDDPKQRLFHDLMDTARAKKMSGIRGDLARRFRKSGIPMRVTDEMVQHEYARRELINIKRAVGEEIVPDDQTFPEHELDSWLALHSARIKMAREKGRHPDEISDEEARTFQQRDQPPTMMAQDPPELQEEEAPDGNDDEKVVPIARGRKETPRKAGDPLPRGARAPVEKPVRRKQQGE